MVETDMGSISGTVISQNSIHKVTTGVYVGSGSTSTIIEHNKNVSVSKRLWTMEQIP
jgi:hypothetical protein